MNQTNTTDTEHTGNDGRQVAIEQLEHPFGTPGPAPASAMAEIGDETVRVRLEWDYPGDDEFDVSCPVTSRSVNQYAHFESYKNGEYKSTYDRYTAHRIRVLFREDGEWFFGEPVTPQKVYDRARYPQSDLDTDGHLPTQVDGITSRKVADRSTRRDVFKKYRYKVTREFVERVDEAYVLEWDEKHEAGREGSYTRQTDATAHKLEAPADSEVSD